MTFDEWHNLVARNLKKDSVEEALRFTTRAGVDSKALHIPADTTQIKSYAIHSEMTSSPAHFTAIHIHNLQYGVACELFTTHWQNGQRFFTIENCSTTIETYDFDTLFGSNDISECSIRLRGYNIFSLVESFLKFCKTRKYRPKNFYLDIPITQSQSNKAIFLSYLNSENMDGVMCCQTSAYDSSSSISEIALILAQAVDYFRLLEEQGCDVQTHLKKITCILSHDEDFYNNIAKTRALRFLWQFILNNCNLHNTHDPTHIVSDHTIATQYSASNDILRLTSMCMTSLLSNVKSFELNFSTPTTDSKEASLKNQNEHDAHKQRLLHTIPLIAYHEAHIGKVSDPLAGSYLIENYTQSIIEKAYTDFQLIEEKKGYRHFIDNFQNE